MAYVTRFEPEKIPYLCKDDEVLKNFPSGAKLYIKSRNCRMIKPVNMSVEHFEELTKDMKCTYSKAKTLYVTKSGEDNVRAVNTFVYKEFKKKKEND